MIMSQRKKKQRDKEEKKKEAARIAKLREAKKDNDEQVTKNRPQKSKKVEKWDISEKVFAGVDIAQKHCTI